MGKALEQNRSVRVDLAEIHGYIATDNLVAADCVINAIRQVFQRLTLFPQTGRIYRVAGMKGLRVTQVPK